MVGLPALALEATIAIDTVGQLLLGEGLQRAVLFFFLEKERVFRGLHIE
jgi:hypothetical protein